MGLIKAALGAAGGVMADQWLEYFYCDSLPENVMAVKGQKRTSGRSSNTRGSDNIISNGSVIAVADGQCMIIVDQGKVDPLVGLKENTGYEIVVLYDGEQHLSKLLQPQDDEMKYIFVLPNIAMASQMMLPKAPCLFATVNFAGQEEPDITFYTEEAATDGLDKLVHSSAG